MTLNSVLTKIKGGTLVTIYDYLSNEMYVHLIVDEILKNSAYHQILKNCRVYGLDVEFNEFIIYIVRE